MRSLIRSNGYESLMVTVLNYLYSMQMWSRQPFSGEQTDGVVHSALDYYIKPTESWSFISNSSNSLVHHGTVQI